MKRTFLTRLAHAGIEALQEQHEESAVDAARTFARSVADAGRFPDGEWCDVAVDDVEERSSSAFRCLIRHNQEMDVIAKVAA